MSRPVEPTQLGVGPRGGQRGAPDVVRQVEVRVVDPDRPPELQRHEPDPLAAPRDPVELRRQERFDPSRWGRGPLEHRDARDVQVRDSVLQLEELHIGEAEPVRAGSAWSRRWPPYYVGASLGSGSRLRELPRPWRSAVAAIACSAGSG
jgi:hypothetical protein